MWQEWLQALVLYREAKTLIDGTSPPDDPRLLFVRGRALAALNETGKAEQALDRGLKLQPNDPQNLLACCRVLGDMGEWERVTELGRKVELANKSHRWTVELGVKKDLFFGALGAAAVDDKRRRVLLWGGRLTDPASPAVRVPSYALTEFSLTRQEFGTLAVQAEVPKPMEVPSLPIAAKRDTRHVF